MKIEVIRHTRKEDHTVSDMFIDGKYFCKVLEDVDRGLKKDDPLKKIEQTKIKHHTAIPAGLYRLALTYSEKYKQIMPLVMNVPGFAGIRIHSGNHKDHTSGCLLVGQQYDEKTKSITNSRSTFRSLMSILTEANKKEVITIEIK